MGCVKRFRNIKLRCERLTRDVRNRWLLLAENAHTVAALNGAVEREVLDYSEEYRTAA